LSLRDIFGELSRTFCSRDC